MAESCAHCWTWPPTIINIMRRSRFGQSITIKGNTNTNTNTGGYSIHHRIKKQSFSCDSTKDSNSNDSFGFYPWDSDGDAGIQWVPEDRVTLFTSQGLVQIGGSLLPRPISSAHHKKHAKLKSPRQESDYMDPNQQLCLGALFDIAATNGLDMGRRLCIFGFCRSVEMLSDVVQDTVLEHGGEIVTAEKASKGGLQEKLSMIVAVPLLWGIPPASETLHLAVRTGGGIVEKVYWQWDFL